MTLSEAVKTIRDYCSNMGCEDCEYGLHDEEFDDWLCELSLYTPHDWRIPPEANIYDEEEVHENCTVQILRNSITGETSIGWWENE